MRLACHFVLGQDSPYEPRMIASPFSGRCQAVNVPFEWFETGPLWYHKQNLEAIKGADGPGITRAVRFTMALGKACGRTRFVPC